MPRSCMRCTLQVPCLIAQPMRRGPVTQRARPHCCAASEVLAASSFMLLHDAQPRKRAPTTDKHARVVQAGSGGRERCSTSRRRALAAPRQMAARFRWALSAQHSSHCTARPANAAQGGSARAEMFTPVSAARWHLITSPHAMLRLYSMVASICDAAVQIRNPGRARPERLTRRGLLLRRPCP